MKMLYFDGQIKFRRNIWFGNAIQEINDKQAQRWQVSIYFISA